jgi:hypothetical protein
MAGLRGRDTLCRFVAQQHGQPKSQKIPWMPLPEKNFGLRALRQSRI